MTNERSITRHPSLLLSPSAATVGAVGASVGASSSGVYRPVPGSIGGASTRLDARLVRRPGPDLVRRRRTAVVFFVGLLTLTGVGVASATSGRGDSVRTAVHVVLPGESLWSIARDAKPKGDIRRLVAQLGEQVDGSQLQPGDELIVPVPNGPTQGK